MKKIELKKKENLERWGGESFEHPLGPKKGLKGGDDDASLRSMSILTGVLYADETLCDIQYELGIGLREVFLCVMLSCVLFIMLSIILFI